MFFVLFLIFYLEIFCLSEIRRRMSNTYKKTFLPDSQKAQMDCFGQGTFFSCFCIRSYKVWFLQFIFTELAAPCKRFTGPHSVECLSIYWERGGCVKEGLMYPSEDMAFYNAMNLRCVTCSVVLNLL